MSFIERLAISRLENKVRPYCYTITKETSPRAGFCGNCVAIEDPSTGRTLLVTVRHNLFSRHIRDTIDGIVAFEDKEIVGLPVAKMWNLKKPVFWVGYNADNSFQVIKGHVILPRESIGDDGSISFRGEVDILFNRDISPIYPSRTGKGGGWGGQSGSVVVNNRGEAVSIIASNKSKGFRIIHITTFSLLDHFGGKIRPLKAGPHLLYPVPNELTGSEEDYFSLQKINQ